MRSFWRRNPKLQLLLRRKKRKQGDVSVAVTTVQFAEEILVLKNSQWKNILISSNKCMLVVKGFQKGQEGGEELEEKEGEGFKEGEEGEVDLLLLLKNGS
mmetsp:Transcript_18008/g.23710  ORF Transcript_18008/g.23710 Transcript_18008/m.23710 type:complete len:100 (+) Transcript_18008:672-971(+)